MPNPHAKGWNPEAYRAQRIRRIHRGVHSLYKPRPKTISPCNHLGKYILNKYMQGQAGTCWVHGGKNMVEMTLNYQGFQIYPICRMLVGWEGEQILGGGNPGDGGTGTAALESMTTEGAGIAHESLDPYTDQASALGRKPPQNVWDDAKGKYLTAHSEIPVPASGDRFLGVRQAIDAGHTVGIGVWCPNNWADSTPVKTNIDGGGEYGHEVNVIGYAQGIYSEILYCIDNWWGPEYEPLDPAIAAKWTNFVDLLTGEKSHLLYLTETAFGMIIDQSGSNAEVIMCDGCTGIPSIAPPTPPPGPTPPGPGPGPLPPGPLPDPYFNPRKS